MKQKRKTKRSSKPQLACSRREFLAGISTFGISSIYLASPFSVLMGLLKSEKAQAAGNSAIFWAFHRSGGPAAAFHDGIPMDKNGTIVDSAFFTPQYSAPGNAANISGGIQTIGGLQYFGKLDATNWANFYAKGYFASIDGNATLTAQERLDIKAAHSMYQAPNQTQNDNTAACPNVGDFHTQLRIAANQRTEPFDKIKLVNNISGNGANSIVTEPSATGLFANSVSSVTGAVAFNKTLNTALSGLPALTAQNIVNKWADNTRLFLDAHINTRVGDTAREVAFKSIMGSAHADFNQRKAPDPIFSPANLHPATTTQSAKVLAIFNTVDSTIVDTTTFNNSSFAPLFTAMLGSVLGLSPYLGVNFGGGDYHGNSPASTDAYDFNVGQMMAVAAQLSHLYGVSICVGCTQDGGIAGNGTTDRTSPSLWKGDSAAHSMWSFNFMRQGAHLSLARQTPIVGANDPANGLNLSGTSTGVGRLTALQFSYTIACINGQEAFFDSLASKAGYSDAEIAGAKIRVFA